MSKRKRPQSKKLRGPGRNKAWNEAMRAIGQSSGASPQRNLKKYHRASAKREAFE